MNFKSFNLKEDLIVALNKLGYLEATPVQEVVIPKALKYENIIAQSATGSGKTHSFLIPILNNLEFNNKIQAIVITPTRELARQTYEFIAEFKQFYPELNFKLFTSGIDTSKTEKLLQNSCEIIVATPGRLKYLLNSVDVDLSNIKTIVLDEADMLMDEGFFEDIDAIINRAHEPQIEVFSATISKKVEQFLKKYISPDYILTLSSDNSTSETVKHYFINTKHRDQNHCVLEFIKAVNPYLLMIFASSKQRVSQLYEFLSQNGVKCGILSGDLKPRERKAMLRRINNNEFPVVVCSDVASRGLDILDVTDVLSVELPQNLEYYYHRAGRCGRNFKDGKSYVFYDSDHDKLCLKLIEQGLVPEYMKFQDGELVADKPINKEKRKKKHIDVELDRDIRRAVSATKGKKVKPMYKKKVKVAVDKVKRKHHREMIRKDIRRQREERYRGQK